MKICMATDFHLSYRQYGLNERDEDFNMQFKKMIDEIVLEEPDIFLILGDIFNTPYPKPISMKIYNDGINKLADNGIMCYGIIGNHTDLQRKDYYQIDNLFENVQLIGNDYVAFDDVFICGVDYHSKTRGIKDIIDCLYEKSHGFRVKIILLHQILRADQEIGYDFDENDLGLGRFDYVFLGHLHKKIVRYDDVTDTVYHYPGSLNSCNVVELLDEMDYGRGYTVFDTDSLALECKVVESGRRFIQYNLTDDDLNDDFIMKVVESLRVYDVKPLVLFNIEGDDVRNIYDMCNKVNDYALSVRYKIKPKTVEKKMAGENGKVSLGPEMIRHMLMSSFDEEWKGDFAYELYSLLSKNDLESGKELADLMYEKHYKK